MAKTQLQMEREILEQPAVLARMLSQGEGQVQEAAGWIRVFDPCWIAIAARGSSDNAARYAQYLFGVNNRLAVGLAAPSLLTMYATKVDLRRALTIGISQSGLSPDVVAVLEAARDQGGLTLAITNNDGSPLARASHICLSLFTGEERAVAATKTYTAELLALAMLSVALAGDDQRARELSQVPGAVEAALEASPEISRAAETLQHEQRCVVLGRGFNLSTACEIALKMKETSYVLAEPYSSADFLHGPVAMIDQGFPVIVVSPGGLAAQGTLEVLALLALRKARIVALSDDPRVLGDAEIPIRLPAGVPEWLSPIVAVVPGQRLAMELALARGFDPARPRGLSKVTLTR